MTDDSRKDWKWCHQCQAIREPIHVHGDRTEQWSREDLILALRKLRADHPNGNQK